MYYRAETRVKNITCMIIFGVKRLKGNPKSLSDARRVPYPYRGFPGSQTYTIEAI